MIKKYYIVYVLFLGISPASDCSLPTFRNPLSFPSSKAGCTPHPAFEDGTDRGFRNVGKLQSDAGEIPPPQKVHILYSRHGESLKSRNIIYIKTLGILKI